MKIGALLPHLLCFGGVKRFISLGNAFVDLGYDYTIYTKSFEGLDNWDNYKGNFEDINKKIDVDFALCGELSLRKYLKNVTGDVYIYVVGGGQVNYPDYRKVYGRYPFILNNREFYNLFPGAYLVEGGVDTDFWIPKWQYEGRKPKVAYYNSHLQNKGEEHIRKELSDIVQLFPFCGLNDKQLREFYWSMDYLVTAEYDWGWSNPAAEAVSCGLPVISVGVNTEPFQSEVIKVNNLRQFFKQPMLEFDWHKTAKQLLRIWGEKI